jgi:hypothetical protein
VAREQAVTVCVNASSELLAYRIPKSSRNIRLHGAIRSSILARILRGLCFESSLESLKEKFDG